MFVIRGTTGEKDVKKQYEVLNGTTSEIEYGSMNGWYVRDKFPNRWRRGVGKVVEDE